MSRAASAQRVPLSEPCLRGQEWEYVRQCLDTGWVSSAGSFVTRFEQQIATQVGAAHAVATSSGTAALHLALIAAGIGPDDEVVVPTLTFAASANAVRYCGGWPTFVDVDPDHWQLDVERVAHFLAHDCQATDGGLRNRHTGRPVKAVMPVHLLGHPCDMEPLLALAQRYGLVVVEDNAEGLGTQYRDQPTGGFGLLSAVSFNGNKIITAGGGGMVVTNQAELALRVRYLSTQARDSATEYVHGAIGYNYRLTNVAAAMGLAQLEQLEQAVAHRRLVAETYRSAFQPLGLEGQRQAPWATASWWLSTIALQGRPTAREMMALLDDQGIESRPLFHPLHTLSPYAGCYWQGGDVAVSLGQKILCLPSSRSLTPEDQQRVIEAVLKALALNA